MSILSQPAFSIRRMASTCVSAMGGKRRPMLSGNGPIRGATMCTVAPCSRNQRMDPRISTSSTPLVQQIATRFPSSRCGSEGGSNRKWLSSRFSSPSAMERSSVEIDGTGEADMSCCMRASAACWVCVGWVVWSKVKSFTLSWRRASHESAPQYSDALALRTFAEASLWRLPHKPTPRSSSVARLEPPEESGHGLRVDAIRRHLAAQQMRNGEHGRVPHAQHAVLGYAGDMRSDKHILHPPERVIVTQRDRVENIERGTGEPARLQ